MARALSPKQAALQVEIQAAVRIELARLGTRIGFHKARIVRPFLGRGVHQATLYRWIDAVLATEDPELAARDAIAAAAAERVKRHAAEEKAEEKAAAEVAREVAAKLLTPPAPVAVGVIGVTPVMQRLNLCISVAEELMTHARTPDGKIRNPRLLLLASDHLGRTIERIAKVSDTLLRADKIEQFNAAVIEAIAEESPEVAERILWKVARIASAWMTPRA